MVFIDPEHRIGDKEIADLMSSVVEHHRSPVRMFALARVFVFEKGRAVETKKSVGIAGEVGWHPVDQHTDTMLVAIVDKVHEVFRGSVAACDRVIPGCLVAP